MRRDYHNWYSTRVDRHMELLTFGHAGTPLLVFPTLKGRFFEFENAGMVEALGPKIDAGALQIFCVDGFSGESWLQKNIHAHERVVRQAAYEDYVLFEVIPLIKSNGAPQIATLGCEYGAYQALNFAMRHPDLVSKSVSLSGRFDMKPFMGDYYDQDFYYNSLFDYLPNMGDKWFLERYRKMRIVMALAKSEAHAEESYRLSEVLNRLQVQHLLDVWTQSNTNEWTLWREMAVKFF
jgi:esterase/lipase superfamily enzyme